jgi:hypothetical protein
MLLVKNTNNGGKTPTTAGEHNNGGENFKYLDQY